MSSNNFFHKLWVQIGLDTSKYDTGLKRTESLTKNFASKIGTVAFAGVIALGIKKATDAFKEFEDELLTVKTLLDDPTSIEKYKESILDLTKTVDFSAKELTKSMFDVVSAIGDTPDAMLILEQSAKLATAGNSNLKSTTKGLTSAYNAFKSDGYCSIYGFCMFI